MKKERGIKIVGAGKVGKVATIGMNNSLSSIILGEEVKKKAFHYTEEEVKQQQLLVAKQNLPDGFIEEYELIQQKKSKLSRAQRDFIVFKVEKYLTKIEKG